MKDERLAQAVGLLDEDLLEAAWKPAPRRNIISWQRWTAVAAACLALALTLRILPGETQLRVQGQSVGETPVLFAETGSQSARSRDASQITPFSLEPVGEALTLELELELKERGCAAVSEGELTLLQGEGQGTGQSITGKGGLLLLWTIENAIPGETYSITVPEKQYILAYDSTLAGWTIFEQKGE